MRIPTITNRFNQDYRSRLLCRMHQTHATRAQVRPLAGQRVLAGEG